MVFLSDSIYISDMPKDELYSKVAAMIPLKTKDSGWDWWECG